MNPDEKLVKGPEHQARAKQNPLMMSLSMNANEVPSAHTHLKQVQKVLKFIDQIKQQIKLEIELCLRDQMNLNQGLQGIVDYQKQQHVLIDNHFTTIATQITREKEKLKEELSSNIEKMKARQQGFIDMAKAEQTQMEEQEMIMSTFALNLNLSVDFEELVPQLKNAQAQISEKAKDNKNARQTVFYQPSDYYLFEPPLLSADEELRRPENFESDAIDADLASKFDKLAYLHQLEQIYGKKLRSLQIFGSIQTVCPSEYFLYDFGSQEIKDRKKEKGFVPISLLKVDHNTQESTYSAEMAALPQNDGNQQLFTEGQAHLWVPDEQKFMFVGGGNPEKKNVPLKKCFLYSVFNFDDVEELEDIRLRREMCSLAVMGGTSNGEKYDSKILAVGGWFNQLTGDYQSACELFDLQLDLWKTTGRLQTDRLSPFVLCLGGESALIVGGTQKNHVTLEVKHMKDCEILDTKTKRSYAPASRYRIPDDAKEILGLFSLAQEVAEPLKPLDAEEAEGIGSQIEEAPGQAKNQHGTGSGRPAENITKLIEKVVLIYLTTKSQISLQFLDCEASILPPSNPNPANHRDQQDEARNLVNSSAPLTSDSKGVTSERLGGASVSNLNQFNVKVNPAEHSSIFKEINAEVKRSQVRKVCQSNTNKNMFFVITENQAHELSCHNVEIEAPPTINTVEQSSLERSESIASPETQQRKPAGDAFGFFSAFKFVKDSVNQVKGIMAADPKKEEEKKDKASATTKAGQAGIIPGSQGGTQLLPVPPQQHKDSLRNVGDDIAVEEVRDTLLTTGPPEQSRLEAQEILPQDDYMAAGDGGTDIAGFAQGVQPSSNQKQHVSQDQDYGAYDDQYDKYQYDENDYDQIRKDGYDYASRSSIAGGNEYAAAAFPGHASAGGDYVYPLASQFQYMQRQSTVRFSKKADVNSYGDEPESPDRAYRQHQQYLNYQQQEYYQQYDSQGASPDQPRQSMMSPNRRQRQTMRRTRTNAGNNDAYGEEGVQYDPRQPSMVQHGQDIDWELEEYLRKKN